MTCSWWVAYFTTRSVVAPWAAQRQPSLPLHIVGEHRFCSQSWSGHHAAHATVVHLEQTPITPFHFTDNQVGLSRINLQLPDMQMFFGTFLWKKVWATRGDRICITSTENLGGGGVDAHHTIF